MTDSRATRRDFQARREALHLTAEAMAEELDVRLFVVQDSEQSLDCWCILCREYDALLSRYEAAL